MLEENCSDGDDQDHLNIIQDHLGEQNHRHPLSVVRCALSLPQQAYDWRRTAIL